VAFIDWWTEVVAQRTENGGGMEGRRQWDARWGTTAPWCAPYASLSGEKKEKGRDGVRLPRRRASDTPARRETRERGGPVRERGEKREPTRVPGKERRTVRGGKASAAPGHGHASAAHVGPAADGFHRTRSDGDQQG
jgi:hypothetical protein